MVEIRSPRRKSTPRRSTKEKVASEDKETWTTHDKGACTTAMEFKKENHPLVNIQVEKLDIISSFEKDNFLKDLPLGFFFYITRENLVRLRDLGLRVYRFASSTLYFLENCSVGGAISNCESKEPPTSKTVASMCGTSAIEERELKEDDSHCPTRDACSDAASSTSAGTAATKHEGQNSNDSAPAAAPATDNALTTHESSDAICFATDVDFNTGADASLVEGDETENEREAMNGAPSTSNFFGATVAPTPMNANVPPPTGGNGIAPAVCPPDSDADRPAAPDADDVLNFCESEVAASPVSIDAIAPDGTTMRLIRSVGVGVPVPPESLADVASLEALFERFQHDYDAVHLRAGSEVVLDARRNTVYRGYLEVRPRGAPPGFYFRVYKTNLLFSKSKVAVRKAKYDGAWLLFPEAMQTYVQLRRPDSIDPQRQLEEEEEKSAPCVVKILWALEVALHAPRGSLRYDIVQIHYGAAQAPLGVCDYQCIIRGHGNLEVTTESSPQPPLLHLVDALHRVAAKCDSPDAAARRIDELLEQFNTSLPSVLNSAAEYVRKATADMLGPNALIIDSVPYGTSGWMTEVFLEKNLPSRNVSMGRLRVSCALGANKKQSQQLALELFGKNNLKEYFTHLSSKTKEVPRQAEQAAEILAAFAPSDVGSAREQQLRDAYAELERYAAATVRSCGYTLGQQAVFKQVGALWHVTVELLRDGEVAEEHTAEAPDKLVALQEASSKCKATIAKIVSTHSKGRDDDGAELKRFRKELQEKFNLTEEQIEVRGYLTVAMSDSTRVSCTITAVVTLNGTAEVFIASSASTNERGARSQAENVMHNKIISLMTFLKK